jgi:hypothetical protein
MTKSISDILIFLFGFYFNIIFISFIIEMFSDWSVKSFSFPLSDMLEVVLLMEWSISDKSIFVSESELFFSVKIYSIESKILKFVFIKAFIQISINTFNSSFIGSVEIAYGIPDLSLNFKIVLEILYDFVVLFNFGLFVIFVEFRVNVLR